MIRSDQIRYNTRKMTFNNKEVGLSRLITQICRFISFHGMAWYVMFYDQIEHNTIQGRRSGSGSHSGHRMKINARFDPIHSFICSSHDVVLHDVLWYDIQERGAYSD